MASLLSFQRHQTYGDDLGGFVKGLCVIGAAITILAACSQGEVTPVSGNVSLAESCRDAGYEAGTTAEFRECQEALADAALIRSRVRELRGNRR